MTKKTKGRILQRVIQEKDLSRTKTLVFEHNHPFYKIFEEKIQQMVTGGILKHTINNYKDSINAIRLTHSKLNVETPMSLEHLEAGFVVWLVSLMFPIIAFMIEWFVHLKKLRKNSRKLRKLSKKENA
jgi:hypothetical protein